ncbi:MAG: hypothetical protein WAN43_15735 [Rhodomicrobium sp.]
MKRVKQIGLWFVSALFLTSGVSHFLLTRFFVAIVPPYLPWPYAAVYVSGAFEIAGAIGLLLPARRRAAGIGLFVLTILVTPANIHMALNPELFPAFSQSLLYGRLVAQVGLLALIYAVAIRRPQQSAQPDAQAANVRRATHEQP